MASPRSVVGMASANSAQLSKSPSMLEFNVPWDKMPTELLSAIENKERPSPSDRREMIRIICASVHRICPRPGRRHLRTIAEGIAAKYQESFRDVVGDVVIGPGHESLLLQMEMRLDNLNRGKGKRSLVLSDTEPTAPAVKKANTRDCYGCVAWQPLIPSGEELVQLRSKQSVLKEMALQPSVAWSELIPMVESTYGLQRHDVNSGLDLQTLITSWPHLFSSEGFDHHFTRLTGIPLLDTMRSSLTTKGQQLERFFRSSSAAEIREVFREVDDARVQLRNDTPLVMGLVMALAKQFQEDIGSIIRFKDVRMFGCSSRIFD